MYILFIIYILLVFQISRMEKKLSKLREIQSDGMVFKRALNTVAIKVALEQRLQYSSLTLRFHCHAVSTPQGPMVQRSECSLLKHMVRPTWFCCGAASCCSTSDRLKKQLLSRVCQSHFRERESKQQNHKMPLTLILLRMTCVTSIHFSITKVHHWVKPNSNGTDVFMSQGVPGSLWKK